MKKIGDRNVQKLPKPISVAGVSNTEVKTTHAIYRVELLLFNENCAVQ